MPSFNDRSQHDLETKKDAGIRVVGAVGLRRRVLDVPALDAAVVSAEHTPHSELRSLVDSGDRVTPIFRKTGTIMLGADAFSRAEDIERALYNELPRLLEQLEAARADLHEVWDLIWNQDGPYIEGGDRMLDEWAQKIRPRYGFEASDPASEPKEA